MKLLNYIFWTVVCMLCSSHLFAETYAIPTGDDNIECSVTTLTSEKMRELLKYFDETDQHGTNHILTAVKFYMATRVTIKNNTQNDLFLNKDRYLEGSEFYIAQKENLEEMYNYLVTNGPLNLFGWGAGATTFGLLTALAVKDAMRNPPGRERSSAIRASIAAGIFSLSCGLKGVYEYFSANENSKQIRNFIGAAHHYDPLNPKRRFRYQDGRKAFKVPAGHVFKDLLLVDLTQERRDFFNNYAPQLLYKKVEGDDDTSKHSPH